MHQVFNAEVGDKAHGWCDMVCRSTVKRISQAEKNLHNNDINVFWQSKAWVDKVVMRKEQARIDENNAEDEGYFWMEDEPLVDNDSDDGGEIDDNPENTSE